MNYIKLVFENRTSEEVDLIMGLLSQLDPQGFEEKDEGLLVFFNYSDFNEAQVNDLVSPFSFEFTKEVIPHENWNAQWESNFEPIQINNQVGVRANFHPAFSHCQYDIVITPKMSFGTGHHETTQMMLEYQCEIDFTNKRVLDFGCGTGVLAILACKKGASYTLGIDNDAWSVENAIENCALNDCPQIDISNQALQSIHQKFDIILANINLNILLENLPTMKEMLNNGGLIILSGILFTDLDSIRKCFTALGLQLVSQKQKKDWISLHIN